MHQFIDEQKIYKEMENLYPQASKELNKFFKIHSVIKQLELEPFFEPLSQFEVEDGKTSFLTELTPELLTAWTCHVSGSTIVRMNSLESAILSNILERRLFPCFVLARSHMESASVVTYATERLKDTIKFKKYNDLRDIIFKYLFGTSIRNEKDSTDANEYLSMVPESTKRFPPSPSKAIPSMNRFFEGITGKPYRDFQMDYATLCDYVHHSIVGSRSFIGVQENLGNGFLQGYSHKEKITGDHVKLVLRIILPNMGIGYSNALMMYSGESIVTSSGLSFAFPPKESPITKAFFEILMEGTNI